MKYYDYPPSEQMKKHEPFEINSHYYVRGNCLFEDKRYPCDFEVAYNLDGRIYVVCYMGSQNLNELFGIPIRDDMPWKMYVPKEESIEVNFTGRDLRYGMKVVVDRAISIRSGMGFSDDAPLFIANSFTVIQTDRYVLENNPPSESVDFEIVNVSSPFSMIGEQQFSFDTGDGKLVYLKPAPKIEKTETGENAILSIPRTSVPIGWSFEDFADLWCATISLATGRDIRWIVKNTHTRNFMAWKFRRRSNIVRNTTTYGILTNRYDFWSEGRVLELVLNVFLTVRKRRVSVEAARNYSEIMWHFVQYRLITNRAQDQARLISTVVEELVTLWEKHGGKQVLGVVSQDESRAMWAYLDANWPPAFVNTLGKLSKQRNSDIKNRLKTSISEEIARPGFGKRLKTMLRSGQTDTAWFKLHAQQRLDDFVTTRNKIAHEGRFQTDETDELFDYYYNMLMVLPLLIFSIFGYSGAYVDLSAEYREYRTRKLAARRFQESD